MKRLAEMFADERQNSRVSGIAATMSRPKISGLRCVAIGRFSAVFSRFSAADSALAILASNLHWG